MDGRDEELPAANAIKDAVGRAGNDERAQTSARDRATKGRLKLQSFDQGDDAQREPFGCKGIVQGDVSANLGQTGEPERGPKNFIWARHQSLEARTLWGAAVRFAANAFGWRQFVSGTPGKQPRLHVLVANVVAGLCLPISKTKVRAEPFLVGEIGFDSISNEKVGASTGIFGQPGEAFLSVSFQADTEGASFCVCHEHSMA